MIYEFTPEVSVLARFNGQATIEELAAETGVYSASPDFVRANCGPLAVGILNLVPETYYAEADRLGLYPNIDVRVHRLYPGDIPAVPGWHADGEFRENYHSQPDLSKVPAHKHLTATISTDPGGVSLTEFVSVPFRASVEDPTATDTFWSQVHRQIVDGQPATESAFDGQLTQFSSWTLHRATPARIRGWRLFFRMSMWHRPYLSDEGGCVSRQEQVYRIAEGTGW